MRVKFLGAVFVRDEIFLPYEEKRQQGEPPFLPPPLTLRRYLELTRGIVTLPPAWKG